MHVRHPNSNPDVPVLPMSLHPWFLVLARTLLCVRSEYDLREDRITCVYGSGRVYDTISVEVFVLFGEVRRFGDRVRVAPKAHPLVAVMSDSPSTTQRTIPTQDTRYGRTASAPKLHQPSAPTEPEHTTCPGWTSGPLRFRRFARTCAGGAVRDTATVLEYFLQNRDWVRYAAVGLRDDSSLVGGMLSRWRHRDSDIGVHEP